jgi:hypothetical protein
MAPLGVACTPLLEDCNGGGDRFNGEIPFCVGGNAGVMSWSVSIRSCLSCGVRSTDGGGAPSLLAEATALENDTDGVDTAGIVLLTVSYGCFKGESDLATTGGTLTSA